MTVRKPGLAGKVIERVDNAGGVFTPVPGKPITLAYSWGPKTGKGQTRSVMLTCPVSAIPDEVWTLLALWWQCRLMRMAPVPGAFLDQPLMVRRAFPVFEMEYLGVERSQAAHGQQAVAQMSVIGAMQVLRGR